MKYAELLALREQTIRDKFLREVIATDKQKEEYQQLLVRITQEADRDLNKQLERSVRNGRSPQNLRAQATD